MELIKYILLMATFFLGNSSSKVQHLPSSTSDVAVSPDLEAVLQSLEHDHLAYITYASHEFMIDEEDADDLRRLAVSYDQGLISHLRIFGPTESNALARAQSLEMTLEGFGIWADDLSIVQNDSYLHASDTTLMITATPITQDISFKE